MPEPIYVVSGFPRSGTSMMMRCLEAGGISCRYDRTKDCELDSSLNPNGFYELDNLHNYTDWSVFRGRALKVIRGDLEFLYKLAANEKCRVIYMRRNPMEIRRSFERLLKQAHESSFDFLYDYEQKVKNDCARLVGFGHSVMVLNYSEVVKNPKMQLETLGFPIDLDRAAAAVDSALYRNRQ